MPACVVPPARLRLCLATTHHPPSPITGHPEQLSHTATCHLEKWVTVFMKLPKSPRVLVTASSPGGWHSPPVGCPGCGSLWSCAPPRGTRPKSGIIDRAAIKDTRGAPPTASPGLARGGPAALSPTGGPPTPRVSPPPPPAPPPPRGTRGGGAKRWAGRRRWAGLAGAVTRPSLSGEDGRGLARNGRGWRGERRAARSWGGRGGAWLGGRRRG